MGGVGSGGGMGGVGGVGGVGGGGESDDAHTLWTSNPAGEDLRVMVASSTERESAMVCTEIQVNGLYYNRYTRYNTEH
jgi:hypothetical protein